MNSLRTARENLNSAKNWGLVDMFGGGFFTTMLKHSKMDQAKQNMEQAKYDFRNFSKELDDVNMACNLNIDTGDFRHIQQSEHGRLQHRLSASPKRQVLLGSVGQHARAAASGGHHNENAAIGVGHSYV